MAQPEYILAMSRVLSVSRITVDLPLKFTVREDTDVLLGCDRCDNTLAHWTATQWTNVLFAEVLFKALSHTHTGITANGETRYGVQPIPFPDESTR